MIPESFATLYALLGLVAPGLVFQLVRERSTPAPVDSTLREASVVALTSLVFTTLACLVMVVMSGLRVASFVDLQAWLAGGAGYVSGNVALVVKSVFVEVGLACGLAGETAWVLARRKTATKRPIARTGVWYLALQGDKSADKASWVLAELADGTRIWGYVHRFTLEDIGDDRDISFSGPGLTIHKAGSEKAVEEDYYLRYVVPAREIKLLKVAHEDRKEEA